MFRRLPAAGALVLAAMGALNAARGPSCAAAFGPHIRAPRLFRALDGDNARCPSPDFAREALRGAADGGLVVLVGCNKGYGLAGALGVLAPRHSIVNGAQWLDALPESVSQPRGACDDAGDVYVPLEPPPSRTPDVFCFDPVDGNTLAVRAALANLTSSLPSIRIETAAFSDTPRGPGPHTATFPGCAPGLETCGFGIPHDPAFPPSPPPGPPVPLTSVDAFLATQPPDTRIAFLNIDTEGHDPAVLRGASLALSSGRVDALRFEFHSIGLWARQRLLPIVRGLARSNMTCYFASRAGRAYHLDPCAWADEWEDKRWSNVVCAREGTGFGRWLAGRRVAEGDADGIAAREGVKWIGGGAQDSAG
ncbi:hypothetical protein DFJ74DRAFT_736054 [Hyaloraphidium curvatum]|nr:hypothetical protein DFJ74DRAFT_736054 [Hyaloraphidium curvatum]